MKHFFLIVFITFFVNDAFAQGINRNGKITNDGSEYVNKNGAIGLSMGVDKNGQVVASDLPSLTTSAISQISLDGATSGGNVTSIGRSNITNRGICWSTSQNPTIDDNMVSNGAGGAGSFTSNLTGLSQNTTYYVRAYATNGSGTSYGNEINFTTYGHPVGGMAICDGTRPTQVVEVTSTRTGKIWMDRNLGASRKATQPDDLQAYGCLYQWGRGNDGHANVTWTSNNRGTFSQSTPFQRTSENWQVPDEVNNPCPEGFRIPSWAELEAETKDGVPDQLGLTKAGFIQDGRTTTTDSNSGGYFWSSTVNGETARYHNYFLTYFFNGYNSWTHRQSVRCIKKG